MARASTRARVHAAALELVATRGHEALTMEGVAAAAGTGKQTLYRSWTSPLDILLDAVLARSLDEDGRVDVPVTGDLRTDLERLVHETVVELQDPLVGRALRAVTAAALQDDELGHRVRTTVLAPQLAAVAGRFAADGVDRASELAELLLGPVLHRWLLGTAALDDGWIERHVARVAGAVRGRSR